MSAADGTLPEVAEYGFWLSPLTSDQVASESIRLSEPRFDGGTVYWLEGRPAEQGRTVPVRLDADQVHRDALSAPWNVRTQVHEYGGGALAVADGTLYFSNAKDQRLYRAAAARPEPLTPTGPQRYADLEIDRLRQRLVAVCEDHGNGEAEQSLVSISLESAGSPPTPIVTGADFYSNPRLSPDGLQICWLQWQHPNLPWDGTELWVADCARQGSLTNRRLVAGGPDESIFQPQWSPDGRLHFVSDRSGYWNLYRQDRDATVVALCERNAEFGLPQWVFGMSTYAFTASGRIACAYCEEGSWHLGLIEPDGAVVPVPTPYTEIDGLSAAGEVVVFRGAGPEHLPSIVRIHLGTGQRETLKESASLSDEVLHDCSRASAVSFPSKDGAHVHAFYYAPQNARYRPPDDELPPLILRLHGGPTGATGSALSLTTQYWTSRGFAVADLNYGGSTGYGRAYRERLDGQWGVLDVDDAVAAAEHFAGVGLADPERVVVKGGSAGGYTVCCCMAFRDIFAAGASYYGIGDLEGLARETHKFESRYLDRIVGPWPEARSVYAERSPLLAADSISAPMIFFQGSEDRVVPKEQTEAMVAALRERNVPVSYYLFEGEAHGFRDASHIRCALDAELTFYSTMLLRKGVRC